jgi:mannose/cellobiose epimerase-like protein (N-acyl-D-glucosamine 2-epimerase family)
MTAVEQRQFSGWAESSLRCWLGALDYGRLLHEPACAQELPIVERFDWDGRPIDPGFRRIRVMGRQTYVLCHAALGGGEGAERLASVAVSALTDRAIGADGQFYARLASDGGVLDAAPDLYDIAFGLFAMAWSYRLTRDERVADIAECSIAQVRAVLASLSGRGFVSRPTQTGVHEQNPHMHLFEAATFLAAFSPRPAFRALADELFELAETTLFDSATGTLPELFDARWRPLASQGVIRVEPGHLYEWAWLLHRYGRLAGQSRAFGIADRLFAFAYRYGHDENTGLVLDAVDPRGRPVETDLRLWPNTEFLKAQVAMQEVHGEGPGFDDSAIMHNVQRIRDHFLTRQSCGPAAALRDGWWIDYLEGINLQPKSDHIPASSLYHIFLAFTELLRHRAGHDPFSGLPW